MVHDAIPFEIMPYDIPPDGLRKDVSAMIGIPYLSKYKGDKQELSQKSIYNGVIMGNLSRLFFSIPTAKENS